MRNCAGVGRSTFRKAAFFNQPYRRVLSSFAPFHQSMSLHCNPSTLRMETLGQASMSLMSTGSIMFPEAEGSSNSEAPSILLGVIDNVIAMEPYCLNGNSTLVTSSS
eukprot:Platyproteum_vivax@DN38_c0_g1_i1.p1